MPSVGVNPACSYTPDSLIDQLIARDLDLAIASVEERRVVLQDAEIDVLARHFLVTAALAEYSAIIRELAVRCEQLFEGRAWPQASILDWGFVQSARAQMALLRGDQRMARRYALRVLENEPSFGPEPRLAALAHLTIAQAALRRQRWEEVSPPVQKSLNSRSKFPHAPQRGG